MSQNQQLFLLANIVSVNTAANTTTLPGALVVGNSSVNVVINSSSVYVSGSPVGGATNAAAQYAWTNTQSFSAVVTHTANVSVNGAIIANGGAGTSGQVLTSAAGGNVYWSTAAGGFSNGTSISVANLAITGSVTSNGSVGTAGQALISTGTGVQWGALSPGYNYSSQFGGGNQWLGVNTANAAFGFGTGDFTVEGWFYPTLNPTNGVGTIFEFRTTANASACSMRINASLQIVFYDGPANVETAFTTRTVSLNTWQHVAFVRIGNTVYGYINGLLAGSVGVTSNLGSSQPFYIGASQSPAYNYYGLASNVRVIKGTGIYTGAFTPPTSSLSAISGTSILTCNAITPTSDSSTNNFQLTNTNGVTTTATQSPFTSTTVSIPTQSLTAVRQQFTGDGTTTTFSVAGGYTANAISVFVNGVLLRNGTEVTVTNGSTVVFAIAPLSGALIDVIGTVPTTYSSITPVSYSVGFVPGSSQYLSIPASSVFQMTADFTIECWAYATSFAGTPTLMDQYVAGTTGAGNWQICVNTSGVVQLYYNGNTFVNSSTIYLNTWYHFALVRIGSSLVLYINGVAATTVSYSGTLGRSDTTFWIGSQHLTGPINYWNGYVSNFRVVKGVGVYTGAFTPPQTPLAIVQSATNPSITAITGTQTSLLTCNGPTIIDGSTNAFTITNNGSAPVSTAIVPTFTNVSLTSYPPPTTIGNIPFTTDGTTWSSTQKIVRGTAVATTSGTSIDFTSIPSWVKRITIMMNAVSTNGTSLVIFQLGSTTFTTSGYVGYANSWTGVLPTSITTGIGTTTNNAAVDGRQGTLTLTNLTGNVWIGQGNFMLTTSTNGGVSVGNVTLGGVLDRVRLTTVNGTDTFDAGSVNILYE